MRTRRCKNWTEQKQWACVVVDYGGGWWRWCNKNIIFLCYLSVHTISDDGALFVWNEAVSTARSRFTTIIVWQYYNLTLFLHSGCWLHSINVLLSESFVGNKLRRSWGASMRFSPFSFLSHNMSSFHRTRQVQLESTLLFSWSVYTFPRQ